MTLYNVPNLSGGIDSALVSTSQGIPMFPIMTLIFIFFGVLVGGSSGQKYRNGTIDLPFWGVLASLTTFVTALLMTLGEGMIYLTTLGIVVAVTIASGVWFFLSKVKGEM